MVGSTSEERDTKDEDIGNGGNNFRDDIDNKATEIIKVESLIVAGPRIQAQGILWDGYFLNLLWDTQFLSKMDVKMIV